MNSLLICYISHWFAEYRKSRRIWSACNKRCSCSTSWWPIFLTRKRNSPRSRTNSNSWVNPLIKRPACFFSPRLSFIPFSPRKVRGYVDVWFQAEILRYTTLLGRVSRPLGWMWFHVERETGKRLGNLSHKRYNHKS